ncbi:MAG TPA: hypothetical protein VHO27_10210, partial [Angustibacter sp.]|nr:hypothetical protein [Angustibacter sp.]
SWLVQRVSEVEEASQAATRKDVDALASQVAALRAELAASLASQARPADAPSAATPPRAQ